MTIGQKIRKRRQEMGLSLRELSDRMGYNNHSTVQRIEHDKVDLPQSKVVKFAEVLGVSVAYLMGWDEEVKEEIKKEPVKMAQLHIEMIEDVDLSDFFQDFRLLDARERKIVKDLAHSLAETKKAEV